MKADLKIKAIIQARRGSTRLPDKVIKTIEGKPMLGHVIDRVKQAKSISQIYLATTSIKKDRILARIAGEMHVETFFGNEIDVLDRYYRAAKEFDAKHIVRITSDCPLIDPLVIDKVVSKYIQGGYDYVSNVLRPTYPDGLDVEVFSLRALEKAWNEATKVSEREHVTPYIWGNPTIFKIGSVENDPDLSRHRWTVDDASDLTFVRCIYKDLYWNNPRFSYNDVLQMLRAHPEILTLNAKTRRNEGYMKSLAEENT